MSFDSRDLDRWITSGRHKEEQIRVECPGCEEWIPVVATTEYGATEWSHEACPQCGCEWDDAVRWEGDEPPEPDIPDEAWDDRDGPWDSDRPV